jgi:hypothetical protein
LNDVLEIVSKLEQTGGILSLNGDRIEYAVPRGNREAQELLDELRKHRERVADFLRQRAGESVECYPPESLNRSLRFGQSHAKLFPFLGRKVRTPAGLGMLLQVFADRCTVLLDSDLAQCARFAPGEIEPVSCEVEP